MTTNEATTRSDKSATTDAQTTRRTFLGAAAAAAGLTFGTSTGTATADVEPATDYLEEWYEYDEREAARGQPVLPSRTPVPEHIAEYWGVDETNLTLVAMADRFLGDDPEQNQDMAAGVAEELREIADEVEDSQ